MTVTIPHLQEPRSLQTVRTPQPKPQRKHNVDVAIAEVQAEDVLPHLFLLSLGRSWIHQPIQRVRRLEIRGFEACENVRGGVQGSQSSPVPGRTSPFGLFGGFSSS